MAAMHRPLAALTLSAVLAGCGTGTGAAAKPPPPTTADALSPSACRSYDRAMKPLVAATAQARKKKRTNELAVQQIRLKAVVSQDRLNQSALLARGGLQAKIKQTGAAVQVFIDAIDDGLSAGNVQLGDAIVTISVALEQVRPLCKEAGAPLTTRS